MCKGSDTLESFLSKVTLESNLRKKLSRIEHVLIVKVSFERRQTAKVFMTHVQVFFRKSLSKATFERKLSSVSLALGFNHLTSVRRRWAPVRGAVPGLHYDDDDDDDEWRKDAMRQRRLDVITWQASTQLRVDTKGAWKFLSKEEKLRKFSWHTCKFFFESHFRKRLSKENFLVCH